MQGISYHDGALGFKCMRLHYSADPAKNPATEEGQKWLEETKLGMSENRWRREMEIDFEALAGEAVFPMFDPSLHVIEPFDINPELWTCWMAADPHMRTPHAFVWLCVNSEGDMVIPFSWWPKNANKADFRPTCANYAECVLDVEKDWGLKPYKRLMDVAGKSMNASEEMDFFQAYRDAGIGFYPARKNRDLAGYDLIVDALTPKKITIGDTTTTRPLLRIMRGNDELVYQLSHLRFDEWRGAGMAAEKDPPERVKEARKHCVDALSYILLDEPRHVVRRRPTEFEPNPNQPNTAY